MMKRLLACLLIAVMVMMTFVACNDAYWSYDKQEKPDETDKTDKPDKTEKTDKTNETDDTESETECSHTGGTATCKEKAVCQNCFEPYGELNADNHKNDEWTWNITETTHKKVYLCCEKEISIEETHDWGESIVALEPTCQKKGSEYRICSVCNYKATEDIVIDPNAHIVGEVWSSDEKSHWHNCAVDGCDVYIDVAEHVWDGNTCTICKSYNYQGVKFTFDSSSSTYSVTSYNGSNSSVIIPSTYKGYPVTSIGESAFSNCTGLTSITIPNSVTSIGKVAFQGCTNLTSITIPDSVTSIGRYAFNGCSELEYVYITDIAKWCAIIFYNDTSNPLYYAGKFYLNNVLVENLVIPDSVTSISFAAFYNCTELKSIELVENSNLTNIGKSAFCGCTGLTSIEFAENSKLTSIGQYAFYECTAITSVTIPNSVTSIGDDAFYGCTGLTSITLPFVGGSKDTNTYLGYIFGASSASSNSSYVPSSLKTVVVTGTSIGNDAFYGCTGLTSITISDSVISIGTGAFGYCKGLTSITIPNSVTSIGDRAFYNCTGLTSVTFENTSGWWYASSSWATSGTAISATDIANASTAAEYLILTYYDYCWKRS